MTRCSICSSPDAIAIDDLLAAGVAQKDVAQQFSVSKFAISRHLRHAKREAAESADDSPTEMAKWLSRADDQYLTAVANADQRAAVQSLVAGLRAVEAELKNREREFELSRNKPDGVPEITIEQFDRLARQAEEAANARGDDCLLIDRVLRFIGHRLQHWPDECRCDLILQFLEAEKTGAAVLWEFQQFIAKRTAQASDPAKQLAWAQPVPAVHGGN